MVAIVWPIFDASGNVTDRTHHILARKEDLLALQAQVDALVLLSSGGRVSFRKTFATPAATWTWIHNLGVRPTVTMTVDGLGIVIPDIDYLDDNTLTIELDSPSTGYLDIA